MAKRNSKNAEVKDLALVSTANANVPQVTEEAAKAEVAEELKAEGLDPEKVQVSCELARAKTRKIAALNRSINYLSALQTAGTINARQEKLLAQRHSELVALI